MRTQRAVAAVVRNTAGRFLVTFNPKWNGYAFPMKSVPEEGLPSGALAITAAEADLDCHLPHATAKELDYVGRFGMSARTGKETFYEYWVYEIDLGDATDLVQVLKAAPAPSNNPPLLLSFEELSHRPGLTWSTVGLGREFVEHQEVVLPVIARPGVRGSEVLLVWNERYHGWFLPAGRVKSEIKPDRLAVQTVRSDLGYHGPVQATLRAETEDLHFSDRFGCERRYRFHLCEMSLPDLDLHQPGSLLERSLHHRGKRFQWVAVADLDCLPDATPTLAAIVRTLRQAIENRVLPVDLRRSEGGIALIQRTVDGRREWLAQWNEGWHAFFFLGGHREPDETFRDCVIREIAEELNLPPTDSRVASAASHHLTYHAVSLRVGELTAYTTELFDTTLAANTLETIKADPLTRWLTDEEIARGETHDARPISPSVGMLLGLAGLVK